MLYEHCWRFAAGCCDGQPHLCDAWSAGESSAAQPGCAYEPRDMRLSRLLRRLSTRRCRRSASAAACTTQACCTACGPTEVLWARTTCTLQWCERRRLPRLLCVPRLDSLWRMGLWTAACQGPKQPQIIHAVVRAQQGGRLHVRCAARNFGTRSNVMPACAGPGKPLACSLMPQGCCAGCSRLHACSAAHDHCRIRAGQGRLRPPVQRQLPADAGHPCAHLPPCVPALTRCLLALGAGQLQSTLQLWGQVGAHWPHHSSGMLCCSAV